MNLSPYSPLTNIPSTQKKDTPTEKDLAQKNSVTKNSQQPTISALEEKNQTPSNFTAQTLSLEELQSQWKKIIEWVGSKSHSLTFILNTAKIARMDGLRVSLNVPYDFHREKLMESKNKKLIEQAMQELTGVPLLIQCDVGAETAADIGGLNALAASFGGEIVAT
jgi:hypothetical protein